VAQDVQGARVRGRLYVRGCFTNHQQHRQHQREERIQQERKRAAAHADGRGVIRDQRRAGREDRHAEPAGGLQRKELGEEGDVKRRQGGRVGRRGVGCHALDPVVPHRKGGDALAEGDDAEAEVSCGPGGRGVGAGAEEEEGVEGALEEGGVYRCRVAVADDGEDEQPGEEDAEG